MLSELIKCPYCKKEFDPYGTKSTKCPFCKIRLFTRIPTLDDYVYVLHDITRSFDPHVTIHKRTCYVAKKRTTFISIKELCGPRSEFTKKHNTIVDLPMRHCKHCKGAQEIDDQIEYVGPVPNEIVLEYIQNEFGPDPFP